MLVLQRVRVDDCPRALHELHRSYVDKMCIFGKEMILNKAINFDLGLSIEEAEASRLHRNRLIIFMRMPKVGQTRENTQIDMHHDR